VLGAATSSLSSCGPLVEAVLAGSAMLPHKLLTAAALAPFLLRSEIVERAKKELIIEKQIKKVEDNWTSLALVFTPLPDSDVTALQVRFVLGVCCCCCRSGAEWILLLPVMWAAQQASRHQCKHVCCA
jgi:hypothetical protein